MTLSKLKQIVHANNQVHLSKLVGHEVHLTDGVASIVEPSAIKRDDCFCGTTSKGFTSAPDFVTRCIQLPPSGGCVAVGNVIDDDPATKDEDAPVVLAVGINYGQGSEYLSGSVPLLDATKMRPKLHDVLASLETKCPNFSSPKSYHLVAANFFPWITDNAWSGYAFNSIEEMSLIRCVGHKDACEHLEALISSLGDSLAAVVFHGANNAVPFIGDTLLRRVASKAFNAVFCDNLAWPVGSQNTISLCSHRYETDKSNLPHSNFDEFKNSREITMEDSDIDLIDLLKMHSDQSPSFDADKFAMFSGDIASFDADAVVSLLDMPRPIQSIVYVKSEEARVFFEIVLPLVRILANKRRIILCSLQIETHQLSEDDFPLFMINAAETTFDLLKRFMRLEGTGSEYLKNQQNPAFIYLYNTGATVEKLSPLMTSLVDGAFSECDRSESTHVVISGVHGQSGLRNCITPAVTGRCSVAGVEWKKDIVAE